MNNEFFDRVERRRGHHTLSDAQRVDNVSGLSFQKRAKTRHSSMDSRRVFASPESPERQLMPLAERFSVDEANDLYDVQISSQLLSPASPESDSTSVRTANTILTTQSLRAFRDLPSRDIRPHEYYRHIPINLKKDTRLRQLLFWFAQNELKNDKYVLQSRDPVTESVKQKFVEQLATTDSMVSLLKKTQVNEAKDVIKTRPKNEKFRERSERIKVDIEDFKKELAEWQSSADKVFEFHAETMDRIAALKSKEFSIDYDQDFMNDIEPDQREFVTDFLKAEPEHKISDVIADMNSDVTQFRQTLNTSNQFLIESDELLKKYNSELAHKAAESTRIIPIDTDQGIIGLNTHKKREDELSNIHTLLRLFSRQSSSEEYMDIDQ